MRVFVLGNSIVKELQDSSWSTISIPGADWDRLMQYVCDHPYTFRNSLVYLHIGPVRFTRLTRERECVLLQGTLGTPNNIMSRWHHFLASNNIAIVLCTIYPMDFLRYNNYSCSTYLRYNRRIRSLVVVENKLIVNYNFNHGMATPYMHKRVFTRRHHSYAFRDRFFWKMVYTLVN